MQQMKDRENLQTEYIGGVFDRQVRIDQWSQASIKKQAVLLLGIGGLGSTVVINLLRLGVGKLFLVDYDVVDLHNINRQLLYSHTDVGKPKVEVALKNSQFHNAGETQIEIFHGNALTNWEKIVDFAKRSTFVYNCIDWGDKFDIAVASLCVKLELPLVLGGTFSTSMTIDYFPGKGRPCYLCSQTIAAPPEMWDKIKPEFILDIKDLSFLPKNNNPIGRSSVIVCTMCGQFMVSHFLNWLFLSQQKPYKASRIIFYHNTFEIVKFEIEMFKKCPYCSTPEDHAEYEKQQQAKREEERKKKQEQANKALSMATKAFEEAKKAIESADKAKQEAVKAIQLANKAIQEVNRGKQLSSKKKEQEEKVDKQSENKIQDDIQKQIDGDKSTQKE